MFRKRNKKLEINMKNKKKSKKEIVPFKYNFIENKNHEKILIYDKNIKKLMKKITGIGKKGSKDYIPGAMEIIYKHFLKLHKDYSIYIPKNKIIYTDPKKRFIIETEQRKKESNMTKIPYKLTIFDKNKNKVFYIKTYTGKNNYLNAPQEMILQKFFERKKINIIKPKFAFKTNSSIINYLNKTVQFLAYDYTNLTSVELGFFRRGFSEKYNEFLESNEYSSIESKINFLTKFMRFKNKKIYDFTTRNVFYKRTKKGIELYVSDTFIENLNTKKLINYAEKKRLIEK